MSCFYCAGNHASSTCQFAQMLHSQESMYSVESVLLYQEGYCSTLHSKLYVSWIRACGSYNKMYNSQKEVKFKRQNSEDKGYSHLFTALGKARITELPRHRMDTIYLNRCCKYKATEMLRFITGLPDNIDSCYYCIFYCCVPSAAAILPRRVPNSVQTQF